MIHIVDKRDCCGCSACVQRCPKHCITLHEDTEGFLYPKVDENSCIDCGLCEKVCPLLNRPEAITPQAVLAVKNCNEEELLTSSSGGVFVAVAHKVIQEGGVVFGAVFDEHWEVKHTYAETLEEVRPMMGSKYLQSRMENCYREAEQFLKQGCKVLFTGTPCQVTGLYSFLRKDYPNLLCVDFLCHGVPSPGIWRRYLEETFFNPARRAVAGKNTVLSSSLKTVPVLTGIEFRDKKSYGWKKYSFVVRGKSASKTDQNSVLLSVIHRENAFMRGFLSDIYLRPSCYRCRCKNGISHSDLTIADYWGIDRLMPDFDDDKGVGLVLVNTEKGKEMFNSLDMEIRMSSLDDARRLNGGFKEMVKVHPKRDKFFHLIDEKDCTVEKAVETCLYVPEYKRMLRWIKRRIGKFIKFILSTRWRN